MTSAHVQLPKANALTNTLNIPESALHHDVVDTGIENEWNSFYATAKWWILLLIVSNLSLYSN